MLLRVGEDVVETVHGVFEAALFHDLATDRPALALHYGDITSTRPLLSRVHSSCVTSELLGACDCDCAEQLDAALEAIRREGRGVLFYLLQEGRGAGLAAKASDRMIVQASRHRLSTFEAYQELGLGADQRHYGSVAAAIELLGITAPLRLLTNNPEKSDALEREKVHVHAIERLERRPSPYNAHYLGSKRASGHMLSEHEEGWAEPPGAVDRVSPERVAGAASLFRIARYWLPIPIAALGRRLGRDETIGPVSWLRAHLYLDLAGRSELVALEWPAPSGATKVPLHSFGARLFERLPLRAPAVRQEWHDVLSRFAERGSGLAVFRVASSLTAGEPDVAAVAAIASRHVPSSVDVLAEADDRSGIRDALRLRGHAVA